MTDGDGVARAGTRVGAQGAATAKDRKRQHLELVLDGASQHARDAGWGDVHLVPRVLPGCSVAEVDLRTSFLGATLRAPVMIAGMTGGFPDAGHLNATLGEAAAELGLAVGVGSQRVALIDASVRDSFAAVRRHAPDAFVLGNVGACQLIDQDGTPGLTPADLARAVEMVGADALAVHLNVVQELVQPEGDRSFTGLLEGVAGAVAASPVPVVAKETGAGMDRQGATALVASGVAALDVGGLGGTSFARIERDRAAALGDEHAARLGEVFADWGIPTAASVLETRTLGVPVIATGGVRSGLDAARALALGATLVGVGRPAVEAAQRGTAALVRYLEGFLDELRAALVLAGASAAGQLGSPVLSGFTLEWARQRALL
ncbi:type 2 isopentenyl-diphosphate Delta-isomerase [Rhabdothermincola salaria]|uniref:type 2 isopentenyl-diphosphate Delta-isomerase n=1 Tax=Rhabdothermincola salaria TaxID=2903142 RepID=UPI001E4CC27C|nr:type 2 isopentenyl-diphosphate Delta-isomerase [Rhabdothermincola salaria]